MTCWNCHEAVRGVVCVGCGVLQPPPAVADPYGMLGLPRRYHVDARAVEDAYRALARQVHPDRYTKKSAAERRMSLQWTAALNDARRTLRDDDRRAWWLATGSTTPRERGAQLDPAFLEEMFEWREAEEDAPGSMRALARAREAAIRDELEQMFSTWEAGNGDLSAVEDRLNRLKYVAGLAREQEHGEHRD